jgi:hypothetical protein
MVLDFGELADRKTAVELGLLRRSVPILLDNVPDEKLEGLSQQSCHQGPFGNRRDLERIDSKERDPHAAFAKIVFEVY